MPLTRCPDPAIFVTDAIFLPCAGSMIAFRVSSWLCPTSELWSVVEDNDAAYAHEVCLLAQDAMDGDGDADVLQHLQAVNAVFVVDVSRCLLRARAGQRNAVCCVWICCRRKIAQRVLLSPEQRYQSLVGSGAWGGDARRQVRTTYNSSARGVHRFHGSRLDIHSFAAARDGQISLRDFVVSITFNRGVLRASAAVRISRVIIGGSTRTIAENGRRLVG